MIRNVLTYETGNEIVTVVVPGLHAKNHRMPGSIRLSHEQAGSKLRMQKFIGVTLIDEQRKLFLGGL